MLVVNEPELAEAVNRLRGDWSERGTGEMTASDVAWADVAAAETLDADVVIFPARYMGELCTRDWLRPVRTNVLQSDDFDANDLFPLVRQELMKWGGQVMAVPLGSQVVTADRKRWPLALGLWAHTAPRVVSRERLGVLFDSQTMKPRIDEPAFVKALEELVEISKSEASTTVGEAKAVSDGVRPRRDDVTVPVIGYGDRMAAVTTSSRNAASAFKLLEWLARADISSRIAGAGAGALPVRRSLADSAKWYPAQLTVEERSEQAGVLQRALGSQEFLVIPRLPGIDKYIAILDSAVKAALEGDAPPQAALSDAAQAWERFTDAKGRDKQRAAYLKHLGIAD